VLAVEVVNSYQGRRERLERLLDRAVDTLEATLDNPDARTVDKLQACKMIGEWSGDRPCYCNTPTPIIKLSTLTPHPSISNPSPSPSSPSLVGRSFVATFLIAT
jgi:hypothetical protein